MLTFMVRMTVLASGSKGNSTIVASSSTRILVDAGLSCRELMKRMQAAGEDPAAIDAILITHEHQDHVQGLAVTARRLGIPVYWTEPTHRAWVRWMTPQKRITYAEWLERRKAQANALPDPGPEEKAAVEETLSEPQKDPAALPVVQYFQSGTGFHIGDISGYAFHHPA